MNAIAHQWRIVGLSIVDPKQECSSCRHRADDALMLASARQADPTDIHPAEAEHDPHTND